MINGSLDILESPITMIFLVGSKFQLRLLFPLWAWWVKRSNGGEGGNSKSARVRGLERPGGVLSDVIGGGFFFLWESVVRIVLSHVF